MTFVASIPPVLTPHGTVRLATRAEIEDCPAWKNAFPRSRKDHRYFQIVEDTIDQGFQYRYLVLEDPRGEVKAIQPIFLVDQDLVAAAGKRVRAIVETVRRAVPRFLKLRTMMVGCAAGEGHLGHIAAEHAVWTGKCLHAALHRFARQTRSSLIVLKEFPGEYRAALHQFAINGYARVPSLPMVQLNIAYASFDEYMTKVLSKATRKDLRRKFKATAGADPIEMTVVHDITPFVDEVHPLYLQVYERSSLHFEKLTREFLCRLGREMPDKTRFFIWRQNGRAIAFSLVMLQGDTLYDEYVGMDYSVALDLHLYHYTLRDLIQWGIEHGFRTYCSTALNYDSKLHLRCELSPLDLYVRHTSPIANVVLKRVLPWLEPTRNDKTLRRFPNYEMLWGER